MAAINVPPNAAVLRNRGFQFKVCVLEKEFGGGYKIPYQRVTNPEGEPETELIWFRIDNSVLATIEEDAPTGWGSLEGWETALNKNPVKTMAQTLAIVLDDFVLADGGVSVPNVKRASKMLMDGVVADYLVGCSNAMLMAQGVDPEALGEATNRALVQVAERSDEATKKILAAFADASDTQISPTSDQKMVVSPSQTGLQDGPRSTEILTSSGV